MKRILILTVLLFVSIAASAQRTVSSQMFIQSGYDPARQHLYTAGVGQYKTRGLWYIDAHFATGRTDFQEMTIGVQGGYLWRIVANSRRSVNLYGGVSGALSCHNIKPHEVEVWDASVGSEGYSQMVNFNEKDVRMALLPSVSLEVFPFRSVAFFINGYIPCQFTTPLPEKKTSKVADSTFKVFLDGSIGIRILLR